MREIRLRAAKPEDAEKIIEWWKFEDWPTVGLVSEPTTDVLCVENGKPISFPVVSKVALIQTIPHDPEAGRLALAKGLKLTIDALKASGIGEVYFFSDGPGDFPLERLALKNGFEEVPWRCYRLKVKE